MLQKFAALIGAAVLTVACAQTDAGITTNIKSKMAADDTVKAYQLDVDTSNGVVTLSGDVDSSLAKARAVTIAQNTDGVRNVVDEITVTETAPTGGLLDDRDDVARDDADNDREPDNAAERGLDRAGVAAGDAAITAAVKSKFLADSAVSGLKIDVDTSNGIVTLTGSVSSRAEADRAVTMARATEGVTRVVNNLRVAG